MLDGLEVTEIKLSEVRNENVVFRIDSDYFKKAYLANEQKLKSLHWEHLENLSRSIKSFGAYSLCNEVTYLPKGIPFVRAQNIKKGIVDFSDCLFIDEAANDLLWKSAIKPRMVMLTMSGSVGESAVALETWKYPINSNQDIAKITTRSSLNPYYLKTFLNSAFGQLQLQRLPVGSVQQHAFIWQLEKLIIPILSNEVQKAVEKLCKFAMRQLAKSDDLYLRAEQLLLAELGLEDWRTPSENVAVKSFADSFLSTGRLDAEYYQPKNQSVLSILGRSGKHIADVAEFATERFDPRGLTAFDYIEIGNLVENGSAQAETVPIEETPSRAQWIVRTNDVITSTVRPIRRLSALIEQDQDGFVCSSGFSVLRPKRIDPEVLLVFLRTPIISEILDLHTTASMYPAISTEDLLKIPIVLPSAKICSEIVTRVRSSRNENRESKRLLQVAKHAVEIAIEQNEGAALRWLEQ